MCNVQFVEPSNTGLVAAQQWVRLVDLAGGFVSDDPLVAEVRATVRAAERRGGWSAISLGLGDEIAQAG